MITIKEGNLFRAPNGIICHQVNCKGVMGRGVAKTFKEKYPNAFNEYARLCYANSADRLLGTVLSHFENGRMTYCMFAQDDWRGRGCNTDYAAFRSCCNEIKDSMYNLGLRDEVINMPYRIGAGLGGGDWQIIYDILEEKFGNEEYNLILWKLN